MGSCVKKGVSVGMALLLVFLAAANLSASAAEFTDGQQITCREAVEGLAELGVLNGKPDGSFDPKGAVTRAEMCKVIVMVLNGGKTPKFEAPGMPEPTFTHSDVPGHWARYFIEYCNSLGVVSGRGDGTFDPDGAVTGRELAKMLLTTVGYSGEKEGFTGSGWASAVDALAEETGLYSGLDADLAEAALTREEAAQMTWNALDVEQVTYSILSTGADGEPKLLELDTAQKTGETLRERRFQAVQ